MDVEFWKLIASQGVLAGVIGGLLLHRKELKKEIKDLQDEAKATSERHRKEIESFHERIDGKAENFGKHLIELSLTSQANDVKTTEILVRLHTLLEGIREAIRASSSRKRGET